MEHVCYMYEFEGGREGVYTRWWRRCAFQKDDFNYLIGLPFQGSHIWMQSGKEQSIYCTYLGSSK